MAGSMAFAKAVRSSPLPPQPAPRPLTARLGMLWLVLAAIVAHAALPTGSALQRGTGSAFSVTTSEVTTIPRRDKERPRVEAEQAGDKVASAAGESGLAVVALAPPADAPSRTSAQRPVAVVALAPDGRAHALFQARAPPASPSPTA